MRKWVYTLAAVVALGAAAATAAVRLGAGPVVGDCAGALPTGAFTAYRASASDGNCLQGYVWVPQGKVRGVVVVVHGLHDHARRYASLAAALGDAGLAVIAQDHRGHGGSGGAPQRLDSVEQLLGDVQAAVAEAQRRFAGAPVVLYGHSMGGMVAAQYAARHGQDLAGAVLSSAALALPPSASPGQVRIVGVLSALAPGLGVEALDEARVVREPAARSALVGDPLLNRAKLPARTVATLLDGVVDLQPRLPAIQVPLLVLHGEADTVTDPAGSAQAHARAASADKTLRLVPLALHDLLHEPEGPVVAAEVTAFASRLVAKPGR